MSGFKTAADSSVAIFKTYGTNMKTYAELEREAYITGNTELAKLYAAATDRDEDKSLQDEVDRLRNIIEEVVDAVRWV